MYIWVLAFQAYQIPKIGYNAVIQLFSLIFTQIGLSDDDADYDDDGDDVDVIHNVGFEKHCKSLSLNRNSFEQFPD